MRSFHYFFWNYARLVHFIEILHHDSCNATQRFKSRSSNDTVMTLVTLVHKVDKSYVCSFIFRFI